MEIQIPVSEKPNSIEGFKVVRNLNGRLYSAYVKNPEVRIEFIVNQTAVPKIKNTRMFAFLSLDYAQSWARNNSTIATGGGEIQVYRAVCEDALTLTCRFDFDDNDGFFSPEDIAKFPSQWPRLLKGERALQRPVLFGLVRRVKYTTNIPAGTVACKSVTLVGEPIPFPTPTTQ